MCAYRLRVTFTALCAVWMLAGCSTRGGAASGDADSTASGDDAGVNTNGVVDEDSGVTDVVFELVGDAAAGEALYADVIYACFVCHGDVGEGTALGPPVRQANALELQSTLAAGSQHTGGTQPAFTDQDYADLAAFLETADPPTDITTNGTDSGDAGTNGVALGPVDCSDTALETHI